MAKLLIVDHDEQANIVLGSFLRNLGHEVHCVMNGRDALASVLEEAPALIILDVVLPEVDGHRFLEVLRSYLRLQDLPVILLTGSGDQDGIERIRQLKVNVVLQKGSVSLDEIGRIVARELAAEVS